MASPRIDGIHIHGQRRLVLSGRIGMQIDATHLVAREPEDDEVPVLVLLVQRLETLVLGSESAAFGRAYS